jgi:hypothetical protein
MKEAGEGGYSRINGQCSFTTYGIKPFGRARNYHRMTFVPGVDELVSRADAPVKGT